MGIHESECAGCQHCCCSIGLSHFVVARATVREKYDIVASSNDDLIHNSICSHICGLCQEAREINYRERLAAEQGRKSGNPTVAPQAQQMAHI